MLFFWSKLYETVAHVESQSCLIAYNIIFCASEAAGIALVTFSSWACLSGAAEAELPLERSDKWYGLRWLGCVSYSRSTPASLFWGERIGSKLSSARASAPQPS